MTIPLVTVPDPVPLRSTVPETDFRLDVEEWLAETPGRSVELNATITAMNALGLVMTGQAAAVAAGEASAQNIFDGIEELYEGLLAGNLGVLIGNSTTSTTIGTGAKSFAATAGKLWRIDLWVMIYSAANPTNWMAGPVTAYDMSDGNPLTVDVRTKNGAGTFTDWVICPTMPTAESSGLIPLAVGTVTGPVATVDIVAGFDNTKYNEYELHFRNITPDSSGNGQLLRLRTSGNAGASFDSGASDYLNQTSAQNYLALTQALVDATTYPATSGGCGVIRINTVNGKNTIILTSAVGQTTSVRNDTLAGYGQRISTTAVNGLRLFLNTGNIASGEYAFFAVRK